ncbi:sulfatase [Pedobacter puniceum]|jgi:arylsulfatase A-like enzyme|uniref:Sulfatase-like hydrolase/transferase n=1 Tax=Pedobacter puniceum TaxID=2666136 RepID=A0A7K0FMM6_9SPHI|nr:sulfatase [Pedobacter puniceum]MRX46267.1 sulfatase-like hydrolase/transferase [Pedobacter puniceum]
MIIKYLKARRFIIKQLTAFFTICLVSISQLVWSQEKPNVLFLVIDDLNDWVSISKKFPGVKTPNIDRLAKSGTYFEKAYSQAPLCGPSRASFLSGLLPSKTGVYLQIKDTDLKQYLDDKFQVDFLPNYFSKNGYKTLGVGKIFHNGEGIDAFDEYGGKFEAYGPLPEKRFNYDPAWFGQKGTQTDWAAFPEKDEQMPDYKYANWAASQLAKKHEKPFFMAVGFIRPHVPWYVPQKWFDLVKNSPTQMPPYLKTDMDDIPQIGKSITEVLEMPTTEWAIQKNNWKDMVQAYLACIAFVDAQVGKVLDALEKSAYKDNTYIVLLSDHGYHLGEKNRFAKHSLWERSAHVPLIISGPGLQQNKLNHNPVGLVDIYPTLLDLCGLPKNKQNDGRSLTPVLRNQAKHWDYPVYAFYGTNNISVYKSKYHYIKYEDLSEEFYDLEKDPQEWRNKASDLKESVLLNTFRKLAPAKTAAYAPNSLMDGNAYFKSKKP